SRLTAGMAIVAITLLIAAILLIFNTIRMAMFARRREIEVMKLVGATNWFIRVPYMAEGLIQGLLGAGVSVVGLALFRPVFEGGVPPPRRPVPDLLGLRARQLGHAAHLPAAHAGGLPRGGVGRRHRRHPLPR